MYRRGHGQCGPEDGQAAAADHQGDIQEPDSAHHRSQVGDLAAATDVAQLAFFYFCACFFIFFATRINTIMDCDRVLVMHAGKVVEFDTPAALCRTDRSVFQRLAG